MTMTLKIVNKRRSDSIQTILVFLGQKCTKPASQNMAATAASINKFAKTKLHFCATFQENRRT